VYTGFIIREDQAAVGEYIGNYIARRINDFAPTSEKKFVLGLPTGSSPIPTYKHLIKLVRAGELSFKNVITFNMDEYVGLPRDHPESYHTFMFVRASLLPFVFCLTIVQVHAVLFPD
jgi:6-phosphogluconolactonase/glucosamine-6-phosphate isomerase/deaminase